MKALSTELVSTVIRDAIGSQSTSGDSADVGPSFRSANDRLARSLNEALEFASLFRRRARPLTAEA
jgi:hypothetical protein